MTTEDIIKDLRYLCDLPAYVGVSETMTLAANAIEGLGLRFDECKQKHNDTRAELERLKTELAQAISERTPHDYGILQDQRDHYRERLGAAAKEVFKLKADLLTKERHIEDFQKAAISNLTATVALVRPEPSRLEIAAMILASSCSHPDRNFGGGTIWALEYADALIAAAK
jgi:hypothetical protein